MVCKQSSTPLICCHLFIGVKIRQSAEKKKGASPFSIALFHNLIFIDTGNQIYLPLPMSSNSLTSVEEPILTAIPRFLCFRRH